MDMVQQPVLHVEARVKTTGDGIIVRTDLVGNKKTRVGSWQLDD